jgi:flotillin
VKELQDAPGSEYFKYLRLKSHEGAINQAKVDVAQAQFLGTTGEKDRQGQQRRETARIEAQAVIFEQERQIEIAEAQSRLAVEKSNYDSQTQIAEIEGARRAEIRNAELQREGDASN